MRVTNTMVPAFTLQPLPAFSESTFVSSVRHDISSRRPRHTVLSSDPGNHFATVMALRERRTENVPGFAPSVFNRQNSQSAVHRQPSSEEDQFSALQAAIACPTNSIHTETPHPLHKRASDSFPLPFGPSEGIYFLGFTNRNSFGASSWLVVRPGATVLFDCPRFSEPLAKRILSISHVDYIVLSHSDDVADHDRWGARLGAKRVIHEAECSTRQGTDECEIKLTDDDFKGDHILAKGFKLLHTPGHSRGSIVMLDQQSKTLFSGDHCSGVGAGGQLTAFERYCFFDFGIQLEQIRRLKEYGITAVLPGHGWPVFFSSVDDAKCEFEEMPSRFHSKHIS